MAIERKSTGATRRDMLTAVTGPIVVAGILAVAAQVIGGMVVMAQVSEQIESLRRDVGRIEESSAVSLAEHRIEGHIATERALGAIRAELAAFRVAAESSAAGVEEIKDRLEGIERALRRVR